MQEKQTWTCPYCRMQNDAIDIYCSNCGYSKNSDELSDLTLSAADDAESDQATSLVQTQDDEADRTVLATSPEQAEDDKSGRTVLATSPEQAHDDEADRTALATPSVQAGDDEADRTVLATSPEQAQDDETDRTVIATPPESEDDRSDRTVIATPMGQGKRETLPIDRLLQDRYRIVQIVGRGGFGAVYKATDERFPSKPLVAIKEMGDDRLSAAEKEKTLHDFRNEADLLVQLSHSNLPRVSDFFEENGKAYLVMEFVQGYTLEDLQIEQGGPLDEPTVLGWALQLCQVLYYLHTRTQPIIFRDMKPANIMVAPTGEIKLIDFGIARVFKLSHARDTTLLGSQGYAPLEQYGQGQSDIRSDIYGLGATLFDLLTHELPVDSPTRHVYPEKFVAPRQLNPAISPKVEAIVLKAMALDPKERYQSALEMQRAIASTGLAVLPDSVTMSGLTTPLGQSSPLTRVSATGPQSRAYYAQSAGSAEPGIHHLNAANDASDPYNDVPSSSSSPVAQSQEQLQKQEQEKYETALKQAQEFYKDKLVPPPAPQTQQNNAANPSSTPGQSAYNNAPGQAPYANAGNSTPGQARYNNAPGQPYYNPSSVPGQNAYNNAASQNPYNAASQNPYNNAAGQQYYNRAAGQNPYNNAGQNPYNAARQQYYNAAGQNPYNNAAGQQYYGPGQQYIPVMVQQKSWGVAFVLFILLGPLGIHRFYAGRWISGLFQLLTWGGFGIWWLIDLILLITGDFTDSHGLKLAREPIRGSQKQWVTAFLLFIFLGPLGVHRFYAGRWISGLLQLLTFGGFGIWTFIDLILLATGNFRDNYGLRLSRQ